jgi:hypothetical protein
VIVCSAYVFLVLVFLLFLDICSSVLVSFLATVVGLQVQFGVVCAAVGMRVRLIVTRFAIRFGTWYGFGYAVRNI